MQEAIGSYNGYFRSSLGNKEQFTLRQMEGQSDAEFLDRIQNFNDVLIEKGWQAWNAEQASRDSVGQPSSGEASFEVESIKLAAGGDHPRWVVKGGNFLKYGVTCWPETLEAAGIADKLDPMRENQPSELWKAHYSERQNEEGRWVPDKVLRLERAEK